MRRGLGWIAAALAAAALGTGWARAAVLVEIPELVFSSENYDGEEVEVSGDIDPNGHVDLSAQLVNDGDTFESITLSLTTLPFGWNLSFLDGTDSMVLNLAPQSSQDIDIRLRAPPLAPAGTQMEFQVLATLEDGALDPVRFSVLVRSSADLRMVLLNTEDNTSELTAQELMGIDPDTIDRALWPGPFLFDLALDNLGNVNETFEAFWIGNHTWDLRLSTERFPLDDDNRSSLPVGQNDTLRLLGTLPEGTPAGPATLRVRLLASGGRVIEEELHVVVAPVHRRHQSG